jgi:hypothetical protein
MRIARRPIRNRCSEIGLNFPSNREPISSPISLYGMNEAVTKRRCVDLRNQTLGPRPGGKYHDNQPEHCDHQQGSSPGEGTGQVSPDQEAGPSRHEVGPNQTLLWISTGELTGMSKFVCGSKKRGHRAAARVEPEETFNARKSNVRGSV